MPATHRFCGSCGLAFDVAAAKVAAETAHAPARTPQRTVFFSPMQQARARLVLIKGEGTDGNIYHLALAEHVVGRSDGNILFPEDRLLSPSHANFLYRESALFIRDEGSQNGVFVRIQEPAIIEPGQPFLIGEQCLEIRLAPPGGAPVADDQGTYFYGSPRRPARLHLVQILAGGAIGMVTRVTAPTVAIGREGNGVNFPDDPFISGRHAQVTALDDGRFQIEDMGSKNGTFLKIRGEARLEHGDYVFLGQQLLRVEIT